MGVKKRMVFLAILAPADEINKTMKKLSEAFLKPRRARSSKENMCIVSFRINMTADDIVSGIVVS